MDSTDDHHDAEQHEPTEDDAGPMPREPGGSDQAASREQRLVPLPDAVQGGQPKEERSAASTNRRAARRQRKRKRR